MLRELITLTTITAATCLRWDIHLTDDNDHNIPIHMVADDDIKPNTPLVLVMHGDPCMWWWYEYISDYIVPSGYVVGLMASYEPTGEPKNMAADMRFSLDALLEQSAQNTTSPIFQKLSKRSAAVGHSAGSNAALMSSSTIFGDKYSEKFSAVASFAPFETPSLKKYLSDIQQPPPPVLILSGTSDCMCPPKGSVPIYTELLPSSMCKFYGMVVNGSHCHFADIHALDNTCYDVEEATCPSSEKNRTIVPKEIQLDLTKTLLLQFLDASLKDVPGSPQQQQHYNALTAYMKSEQLAGSMTSINTSCHIN